jgi:hypothetical protein
MTGERWYDRHAWIYFAGVAAVGLAGAATTFISPSSGEGLFGTFGFPVPAAIAEDPDAVRYVEHIFGWASGATVGLDLFGLLIAATAFRRGERWAWLAFWYWPTMFLSHFLLYESGFRYLQLVWLVLSLAALGATAGKAWSPPALTASPTATAIAR